jgi:hypothetical protein
MAAHVLHRDFHAYMKSNGSALCVYMYIAKNHINPFFTTDPVNAKKQKNKMKQKAQATGVKRNLCRLLPRLFLFVTAVGNLSVFPPRAFN